MKRTVPLIVILLLALLLRIIHIGFPAGGYMSLQQVGTAVLAQGLSAHSPSLPHVELPPGSIEAVQFPLFPSLIAFCYGLFTPCDTWGRILSVLFSLMTIAGLYRLANALLGRRTALWAGLFYAILPMSVFYGRAIMSESLLLMCTVWGLFYVVRWSSTGNRSTLLLSALFISCAVLLRLSTLYVMIPLAMLSVQRGWGAALRNPWHWLYALIVVLPAAGWLYHVHRQGLATGPSLDLSLLLSPGFYSSVLFNGIAGRQLTYAGGILFLFGVLVPRQKREEKFLDWWLGGVIVYILFTPAKQLIFDYYQLPFILPACLFMAKAANEILAPDNFRQYWQQKRFVLVLVALCVALLPVLSAIRIASCFGEERLDDPVLQLGSVSQRIIGSEEKVVSIDRGDPLILYACRRDGWHASADNVTPASALELHFRGAAFIIGTTATFDTPERREHLHQLLQAFPAIVLTDSYFIIRLVMEPGLQ